MQRDIDGPGRSPPLMISFPSSLSPNALIASSRDEVRVGGAV